MNKRILLTSVTASLTGMGISLFIAVGAAFASAPASAPAIRQGQATAQATAIPLNLAMTSPLTRTQFITAPRVAMAISTYFTVPLSQVVTLHAAGWGYGEIFKLYHLSLASGKMVTEVKALRDAGMGWGNIAKEMNVRPGNAGVNLGAAVSERQVLAITAPNMTQPQMPRQNEQEPGRRNNSNHDNNGNHGNGKPEKPKKDK